MIRKGFKMKLHAGCADEYARRHAALWPEMKEMIHAYGGRNYSIFLDEETNVLYGYIELEDEARWNAAKYDIVLRGNLAKFSQNPELAAWLAGTGERVLIEASPWDGIWGVKLTADDPRIGDPAQWQGENLLGFALMEVRDRLSDSGIGA